MGGWPDGCRGIRYLLTSNPLSTLLGNLRMKVALRFAIVTVAASLMLTGIASATGGTCSNFATGACPASVPSGVTSFYFIDYVGGSDSNAGTSESGAWKHTPGMANASGNAASHIPTAGEGWIFKGGVTVDYRAWPANVPWNGTAGNPTYMGVDPGWYAGSAWARPVFSGGGSSGYDAHAQSLITDIAHHSSHVIIDNLEFTGLYWRSTCSNSGPYSCGYVSQYGYSGSDVGWELKNLYVHGWGHCAAPNCDDPGNEAAFLWAKQSADSSIHDSVVDGSDSSKDCCNAMSAWNEYNNYIAYVDNAVFGDLHQFHDNVITNMVVTFGSNGVHGNCIHLFGGSNITELVYNNYVTCLNTGTPDEIFLVEEDQATVYAFNNVMVKDGHGSGFELGLFNSGPGGTYILFNNTLECGADSNPASSCITGKNGSPRVTVRDNFYVTANSSQPTVLKESGSSWNISLPSPFMSSTCSGRLQSNTGGSQICAPIGFGNGAGNLNLTETYPFAPLDSTAASNIGTGGTNFSLCNAIANIDYAAGRACRTDTTLGVAYNTANHTVTSPARNPFVRPSSGGWRLGAYEYNGTAPAPPAGLQYVVQ
jgi:hypothetical protein